MVADAEAREQEGYRKILFRLQKNADGYPPDEWETLWAQERAEGLYQIDNIPFYVNGVGPQDLVRAEMEKDALHFRQLILPAGHSVLRVKVFEISNVADLRADLAELGCVTELSHVDGFISVDVPPSVSLARVRTHLEPGKRIGRWEYEEATIRHK